MATRYQPEEIREPLDARMVEAIQKNFEYLFRDLADVGEGVLEVPGGGTGLDDVEAGALLVGTGGVALGTIPDVALGNVLISGGVGVAPSYGKVGLTTHVSGILPIANGGTSADNATDAFDNLSPLTTLGDLLAHDGTHNVRVPVGTDGQFLKADSGAPEGVSWDEPIATHELLEEAVHTDTDTQTRVLGDMIAAQAPTTMEAAWIEGELLDQLPAAATLTGEDYWLEGESLGQITGGSSGTDVKWRRLPIGTVGQVLRSNGTQPEWSDPGVTTEIIATAQPKVRVYANANKSIASGAGTDSPSFGGTRVEMGAESYDTDGFHSTSSNTARLTVPSGKGGTYLIVAQASFQTSATGRKACWIVKNNTFRAGISEVNGDDGGLNLSMTATSFAVLADGDYIELHVRQDSGGAIFALGGTESDGLCSLAMYKLP